MGSKIYFLKYMETKPKLSILIPTYNRLSLLRESLESLLKEKPEDPFEIVVVDDGSRDGTWDYLEDLKTKAKNLIIARHPENLGVSQARNTLLSLSQGEYVLFLDSDDYLLKGAVREILEALHMGKPSYLLSVYVKKGERLKPKVFPEPSQEPLKRLKDFLEGKYADALYVFKKSLFENFRYSPQLKIREDWVFKATQMALNPPMVIRKPLGVIRDHPQRLRREVKFYEESIILAVNILFEKLPENFKGLYPYALSRAFIELGGKYASQGNYDKAFMNYKEALRHWPNLKYDFKFLKKYCKSFLFKPWLKG